MIRRLKGAKYLTKPTQPLQIDRDRSVPGLLEKMEGISFQGRNQCSSQLSALSSQLSALSRKLIAER